MDITTLSQAELVKLHNRIVKLLPTIETLDLQQEIVYQFIEAKQLLADARVDGDIQANQKAQLQNSVAALIKQLTELQKSMFSPDQARKRELALTRALKSHPELQESYLNELEALLEQI